MSSYNDTPEACLEASDALLKRGAELVMHPTAQHIWENIGFHAAYIRLGEVAGIEYPRGPQAQAYISLILAAAEHVHAQRMFDAALDEVAS